MGIINLTPDSFFEGSRVPTDKKSVLLEASKKIKEGADFLDLGGYSTRPGAENISIEEEINRVIPAILEIKNSFPETLISIDTFRSIIAKKCIENGACIVNDISAGSMDTRMFKTIAKLQVPYIIMHMQGTPKNMQSNPTYNDIVNEVLFYFSKKIVELRDLGVNDIITDVGFGFGKTLEHNYHLLKNLSLFKNLEVPILAGVSRKSMLFNWRESYRE